jgi:Cu-processing system permease protein
MIGQTAKVLRYELHNLMRSRWLLFVALFFLLSSEAVLRFGSDPSRAMVSLMNIVLIVIPLMSLILGIIYFYQSREFVELLLAQPMTRASIYMGKIGGLSTALTVAFIGGLGLPFVMHGGNMTGHWHDFGTMIGVGFGFVLIFTSVAFMIATFHEDKIKGFGTAILLWLYISVIYDAAILLGIYLLREYPLEKALIVIAMLNPVDLGRILILLRLDIAALMGYTGAVFNHFNGSALGIAISSAMLLVWLALPLAVGMWKFNRKDF